MFQKYLKAFSWECCVLLFCESVAMSDFVIGLVSVWGEYGVRGWSWDGRAFVGGGGGRWFCLQGPRGEQPKFWPKPMFGGEIYD